MAVISWGLGDPGRSGPDRRHTGRELALASTACPSGVRRVGAVRRVRRRSEHVSAAPAQPRQLSRLQRRRSSPTGSADAPRGWGPSSTCPHRAVGSVPGDVSIVVDREVPAALVHQMVMGLAEWQEIGQHGLAAARPPHDVMDTALGERHLAMRGGRRWCTWRRACDAAWRSPCAVRRTAGRRCRRDGRSRPAAPPHSTAAERSAPARRRRRWSRRASRRGGHGRATQRRRGRRSRGTRVVPADGLAAARTASTCNSVNGRPSLPGSCRSRARWWSMTVHSEASRIGSSEMSVCFMPLVRSVHRVTLDSPALTLELGHVVVGAVHVADLADQVSRLAIEEADRIGLGGAEQVVRHCRQVGPARRR